jgi:hypothetical protein
LKEAEKAEILAKAPSIILLSLFDEVSREVVHETTAAELWKKLKSKFQNKSLTKTVIPEVAFVYLANVKKYTGKKSS